MANRSKKKIKQARNVPRIMRQGTFTPWFFILPALVIIAIYIAYPVVNTFILSLKNSDSTQWATAACREGQACWGVFENYRYALTSDVMLTAFLNNILFFKKPIKVISSHLTPIQSP